MKLHLSVALFGLLFATTLRAASVADTKFEHGRGFYETPFEETITTKTKGATLVYTLTAVTRASRPLPGGGRIRSR